MDKEKASDIDRRVCKIIRSFYLVSLGLKFPRSLLSYFLIFALLMKLNMINKLLKSGKAGRYILYLLVIFLLGQGISHKSYRSGGIIQWDVVSYYAYLPAIFIYRDLSFDFVKDLPEDFEGTIWPVPTPTGKHTLKYSIGTAIMYLPFFIVAHIFTLLSAVKADGYTWPYHFFILVAAIFYMLAGLLYLRKVLLNYFSEKIVIFTLVILALGTNLLYYSTTDPGMSHIYSFFLFSAFLFHLTRFYQKEKWIDAIFIGVFSGLIVLVRPSNILIFLFFLLYRGRYGLKDWSVFLWRNRIKLVIVLLIGSALLFLQLSYWKYSTGTWLYDSYGDERFYFLKPHVIDGIFSYRKGWLVYTPLMTLALIGIFFLRKKVPELFYPILVFTGLNIYIAFSWWCWWYGGGFGARALVESYALLALPLAATLERLWNSGRIVKAISAVLVVFFIYLNIFQSRQYRTGLIHYESTSKELYWTVFLKNQWPDNYDELVDHPDSEKAFRGE